MRSKTIYIACFALLFSVHTLSAQSAAETETARKEAQKEAVILSLDITDQQAEQLMKLDADFQTKLTEAAQNNTLERSERKAFFDRLKAEHKANQLAVLTPEQRAKFEASN